MKKYLFLFLLFFCAFIQEKGYGQLPTVYFNKVYKSTGTGYSTSTNSITVGAKITGSNFKFVGASSSTLNGQFNGNDIAGTFSYFDASGNLVQIGNGTISRLGGGNGKTWYFYLVIPSTGYAYLLVAPQYDSSVSDAGGSFNTNSSGVQTDLNAFLSSQSVVTTSASISPFTTCLNTTSSAQSFTVSGSNLSADITVKAPTNYQVSTSSGSGYVDSLTLSKGSGTSISSTTIYVRLKSIVSAGTFSGDVTAKTTNAGTQYVYVTGSVYETPAISSQPASSTVCPGNATSFSVTASGSNLTYKWQYLAPGGSWTDLSNTGIYTGVTTSVLRLSSSLTNTYNGYQYRCLVSGSCTAGLTSTTVTLTVNSAPSISSQPSNSTVCSGNATSFSVTATGTNLTYQWQKKIVGGASFTNISNGGIYSNATTSTLNISSGVTTSEDGVQYQCIVSGTCSPSVTSNAATITVNAVPATPASISGLSNICMSTIQTYSVAHNNAATTYTWTVPGNWTGSSTEDFINITSGNISETVNIKVKAGNACGYSSEVSLSVSVNSNPAPIISFTKNAASQCLSGNSFTFTSSVTTVSGVTASSYSWDYGDGSTLGTSANGSRTYATANSYDVKLTVTASNNCVTSYVSAVTVNPAPTSSLTGTTSICNGNSATLSTTLTGTSPWSLTYTDGTNSTTLSGITNANYTFNVSPTSNKTYTITSLTDNNCSTSLAANLSGSAAITVNSNVNASVSITSSDADNTFCSGASVTFTASPTNGNSPTYSWLKNGIAISGATSSTYISTGIADYDVISVQMTAGAQTCLVNNTVYSNEITNRVAPGAPRTPALINGQSTQCAGVGGQVYSIAEVLNATSYTWTVPTGWTITTGSGTTSATVTVGTTTQTGDITVSATNGCGTSTAQSLTIGTINTTPTISSTTPSSSCGTSTVSLAATASGGTISWYAASTGGSALSTGTSYTTPSISTTTTYYISTSDGTCTSAPRTAIIATIKDIPTINSNTPGSRCGTGTVSLGATASAGTISWYSASTGGSALTTGTGYTTPSISVTTTYYVDATNNGCTTATRTAIAATINTIPTITTNTPGSRCGTGTVALGATASAGTVNWYTASSGGSSVSTGTSYTTPSISSTTNYYVDATSNGCTTASRTSIAATINAIPTISTSTPASRCGTGTVTLGATASAGTINWYTASTGGSTSGSGTSFTTPSISTTTSYFVDATTSGCTSSSRTEIIATINSIPTITSSSGDSRCGSGSVTLTAGASSGSVKWYDASTNGNLLATATSYSPSISSTTSYYVEANDGTCASNRTTITATIKVIPTISSTTPNSNCGSGTVSLAATASGGTISWYAASTGGSALSTGTSYTTPNISSTTTYYVDATDNGCTSASRTSIAATINDIPSISTTSPAANCGTGTVTLGATASAGTISWYSASTGGSALTTGTSYTTPSISVTTTYYVDATNNGCTTASRTAIAATINAIPTIATNTPGSRCGTGTVALGATASAGTVNWYTASSGGSSVSTGTSYTTPSISSTTNYYVDATSNGCTTASRTSIAATINAIPTISTSSPASRCGTGTVTLGATASAGTINWYSVSTGGSSDGTGTNYTTPSISSTTTYYVDATTASCTSVTRTAIVATVNAVPSISSSAGDSRCGTGAVTLTATPSSGNIDWYAASTGGSSLNTANSYSPTISTTTTYYAEAIDGGCSSARTAVTGTVTAIPTITATTGASLCTAGTANLSATVSAGTVKWYDAASSGTLVNTGTSFTTPSLSATTSYYVEAVDGTCTSASRSTVTVTYGSLSVSISGTTTDYDLVSLTASGGTSYSWDGGNSPSTAANTFDDSGTYTVTVTDGSGCSNSQSVQVTVKVRGLNRYGQLIDVKNNQVNRYGEMGSNTPILKSGQLKAYAKNLNFFIDASNTASYSGSGTTWNDLSLNALSNTLTNGPSYSSTNGGIISFDGSNDYISVPSAYPGGNDISIEAWVNPSTLSGFRVIANMDNWSRGYIHFQFSGSSLQFALSGESDKYANYTFSTNTWYHVVAVYDKSGKSVKFYVNGTLTNTETYSNPPKVANQAFKIGGWSDNSNLGRFFNGSIGLIRMYGTPLSSSQISTNFNNTKQKFGL
jgi:hypothetical protein